MKVQVQAYWLLHKLWYGYNLHACIISSAESVLLNLVYLCLYIVQLSTAKISSVTDVIKCVWSKVSVILVILLLNKCFIRTLFWKHGIFPFVRNVRYMYLYFQFYIWNV